VIRVDIASSFLPFGKQLLGSVAKGQLYYRVTKKGSNLRVDVGRQTKLGDTDALSLLYRGSPAKDIWILDHAQKYAFDPFYQESETKRNNKIRLFLKEEKVLKDQKETLIDG